MLPNSMILSIALYTILLLFCWLINRIAHEHRARDGLFLFTRLILDPVAHLLSIQRRLLIPL